MQFSERRLSNGLPLFIATHSAHAFATIELIVRGGTRAEGNRWGLADFTCRLLSLGAAGRDAVSFAQEVEYIGADLVAEAGRDGITIQLDVLTEFLPEALGLMSDILLRPHFDPQEIERERKQRLAGLKQSRSDAEWLAAIELRRRVHGGNHPYGREIDGVERTIRSISRDEMMAYHRNGTIPERAFLVAAGDVDPDELAALLEEHLGEWSNSQQPLEICPGTGEEDFTNGADRTIILIDRPESAHTSIRMGRRGTARRDPDFIPLRVITTLLGDYFNSRLNQRIREGLGYAYEAWSYLEGSVDPGSLIIGTSVRTDRAGETVSTIFDELDQMVRKGVDPEELQMVQSYLGGRQALLSETPEQLAGMMATIGLHGFPANYFERYIDQVRSLTPTLLAPDISRYLAPERMITVLAGDAERLAPQLTEHQKVIVVNDRGKVIG